MKTINIDWQTFEFYVQSLISKLEEEATPGLIVGLSRGGLPLATTLSNRLNVPMIPLEWSLRDNPIRDTEKFRNILKTYKDCEILLVDDLIDSGKTYIDIWSTFEAYWSDCSVKVTPVVMLYNTEAFNKMPNWNKPVSVVKFQRSKVPEWFVWPWE